jgi:hypothetical protein
MGAARFFKLAVLGECSHLVISVPERHQQAGLLKLLKKHPQAEAELIDWYKVARAAAWKSLEDVRVAYSSADMVGAVLVLQRFAYDRKGWTKWA